MKTTNYHVISVKYLGPTNFSGSRVKLTSKRFEKSRIISYDYSLNGTLEIAEEFLTQEGFNIIGHAEFGDMYLIISDTFKSL